MYPSEFITLSERFEALLEPDTGLDQYSRALVAEIVQISSLYVLDELGYNSRLERITILIMMLRVHHQLSGQQELEARIERIFSESLSAPVN